MYIRTDWNTVGQLDEPSYTVNRIKQASTDVDKHLKYVEVADGEKLGTFLSFNYARPVAINSDNVSVSYSDGIDSAAYPTVPEWNQFANGDTIRFVNDITSIGTYSYINWSAPLMLDAQGESSAKRLFTEVNRINLDAEDLYNEQA